ncbi:MAG TPA: hypothetical protein VGN81_39090 [Pseudonocardiaceae bacterium]
MRAATSWLRAGTLVTLSFVLDDLWRQLALDASSRNRIRDVARELTDALALVGQA